MMWWSGASPWMAMGGGLVMVLLIGLAVWLARGASRGPKPTDPMETLKRRLASGEINQEQHERIRKVIKG
jgi:uncharacterized membrane protein